ncbi:efflux RND transporter permease subunit [Leptospira sp. 85282-16]|nr:efflux RND transporter permease subunit [Leptospira sp. 85282-16]
MILEKYVLSLFKHKKLHWVIFFCCLLGVIFRIPELEIWLLPKLTPIRYYIVTEYPNHSAEDTDLSVSVPISDMVSSVKSVKRIRTGSEHGKSVVQIDLQFGASVAEFKDQLYQNILEMKDKLPLGVETPRLLLGDSKERPFFEILIPRDYGKNSSSFDFYLQQFVFQLERISGVTEVRLQGKPKHSIFISLKSHILDVFPINIRDMESQIQTAMRGGSLGKIEGYTKDTELKFSSDIQTMDDISKFPISLGNGNSVNLGQIATIIESESPQEKLTSLNGKNVIYIAVFADQSANPLRVSSEVQKIIQNSNFIKSPIVSFDASNELRVQLKQFGFNLVWSLVFAFIFSFLIYRNAVPAIILLISVVSSLILFFHFVLFFSISINLLSLGGISVGIGMLFDASNLIVFSIRKQIGDNIALSDSIAKGIRSVFISLFSSSITTMVVFIPLLVYPMEWKHFFFDSGVCIALLVFCSLVSSLWIVPLVTVSFANSLNEAEADLNLENLLFSKYEKIYELWNGFQKRNLAFLVFVLVPICFICFRFDWKVFPKQPILGFNLQMTPKANLPLTEELSAVNELQTKIRDLNPEHPILVFPLNSLETKRKNPEKAIPLQWKLIGFESSELLENVLGELLSSSKWDWKLLPIETQVSIALPFIPKDSTVFLHESFDELLKYSKEFKDKTFKLGLVGGFDFFPKLITMEEWSRNQIPISELIPNEEDLKQRILYQMSPKFLGTMGETSKRGLYLRVDASGIDFGTKEDSRRISFKTRTYETTFIGSLFTSKKESSYSEYRRESGLFYMEWLGDKVEPNANLLNSKSGLSVIHFSAQNEIKKFFQILLVLLLLSFIFIYLALVGIYESFRIPFFYLSISLLYLCVAVSFVFIFFREFHLGHYIGLIILLGLSIDSISLFGERWMETPQGVSSSRRREFTFRWLLWPILLNSGTTLMGIFPVIAFGIVGSEFSKAIALTMFVGIPISIFFVFYIYPSLFEKYLEKVL